MPMKLARARVSTTHVDRHNERMTRQALEDAARQVSEHYIPVMWNHDIRYPPLGRVISAEVVPLEDGEFALETMAELWEEGDPPDRLRGDGRRTLRLRTDEDHGSFIVRYDRTFLDEYGWILIQDLAALSRARPVEDGKKAVEPVSTLVIAAGAFALGGIASGFFGRLGSDSYDALKRTLKRFLGEHPERQILVDFEMVVQGTDRRFEVHILLDGPTSTQIEEAFSARFGGLDETVEAIIRSVPSAARIVLEQKAGRMQILYVVTANGVPLVTSQLNSSGTPQDRKEPS